MGFFDMFRSKSPADTMQEEMKRLAPTLFPGGHEEIQRAGKSISGLLDNRIPPDASARLFASTKYLAYTAKDKSRQRVVEYIVRQGMGRISEDDAEAIYDRFIKAGATEAQVKPVGITPSTSDTMYIDDSLEGRKYRLQNSVREVQVSAIIFTVMLVGLRSQGWEGAAELFTPKSTEMKPLSGSYLISERDAREMSAALQTLLAESGLDSETEAVMRPLISIASQGSFTVHA